MRGLNTALKLFFLTAALVLIGSVGAFAQTAKAADEYVSAGKFSFRIPKDSVANASTNEQPVIYWGRPRMTMGSDAAFMLTWRDAPTADKVAELFADDTSVALIAAKVVDNVAGTNEHMLVDKERVQVAGLKALKVTLSVTRDKIENLCVVYTIPCPEQKRIYTFTISTTTKNFDAWFAVAEPSVNSFKILKN